MLKKVLLFSLIMLSVFAHAQVNINGKITDHKGRPLNGASVGIKGSYDGSITDSTGFFSFQTFEKGNQTIEVSNIGFKKYEQVILIEKSPVTINIALKEQVDELTAVTVTAGSFEASDKKRAATVLTTLDVLTVGGANADITAAVKTLPGAQQVGEQEGLFVRGGAGYETKQFIDGMLVANPFFSSVPDIASRGRFSPSLFKGTVFSAGGYSALYGQALSSALILESIDLPDRSSANASISTVFVGGGIQQLAKNKKSTYGFNYGYTNVWPYFQVVEQTPDYFRIPEFHTADANFRIKTKNGGMIKYYSTFGYSKLGLRRADIDSAVLKNAFGLNNINWYNNLTWRENLGNGWKMNLGFSYSYNYDDISQQVQNEFNAPQNFPDKDWLERKNFTLNNKEHLTQLKAVLERKLHGISVIRFGGEYWYMNNKPVYNNNNLIIEDHFKGVFGEADLYITNALAAKAGIRLEHASIINRYNVAPRFSMAYKTGKGAQVSFAYGIFYQKPENNLLLMPNNLDYTKATHYIINYQKSVTDRIFRVELFYKDYASLVKTQPVLSNNGNGYAKGIEFFWRDKKTIRNLDYWISYSYLDTKRNFLNFPYSMQPNFATEHTASVVVKRFYTQIKTGFNFTYSIASGRPYYNIMQQNGKPVIADEGRTRMYNNLGFSMNYVTSFKKAFAVVVASVTNVLGTTQVFGYNYSNNGMIKQPVTPPAERFFFIGVFLSWGIDRTQDAINNNL